MLRLLLTIVGISISTFVLASTDSLEFIQLVEEFNTEIQVLEKQYTLVQTSLYADLKTQRQALTISTSDKVKLQLLIRQIEIKEQIARAEEQYQLKLTRLRFKKGIELIKMIYEKILGLDHHFSSLQTYQSVASLTNPTSYPNFQKVNDLLVQNLKKDNAVQMPSILETNPYTSVVFSLVSSFIGSGDTRQRDKDLEEIACIIDFTARMNSELSTIYYETEYLKENNRALKQECINLFSDYTKVIDYSTPLDVCRKDDDWDLVYEQLDNLIEEIDLAMKNPDIDQIKTNKKIINLEFSIDRLLNFINIYNNFISQGEKYYRKFQTIVSNYPNEDKCLQELPHEFNKLKQNIEYSIDRFNEAYNIAELKGSKLKDLLYGFTD